MLRLSVASPAFERRVDRASSEVIPIEKVRNYTFLRLFFYHQFLIDSMRIAKNIQKIVKPVHHSAVNLLH